MEANGSRDDIEDRLSLHGVGFVDTFFYMSVVFRGLSLTAYHKFLSGQFSRVPRVLLMTREAM